MQQYTVFPCKVMKMVVGIYFSVWQVVSLTTQNLSAHLAGSQLLIYLRLGNTLNFNIIYRHCNTHALPRSHTAILISLTHLSVKYGVHFYWHSCFYQCTRNVLIQSTHTYLAITFAYLADTPMTTYVLKPIIYCIIINKVYWVK